MDTTDVKRKLAVILAADFEGYLHLMHEDEDTTLRTLGAYREIIDNLIERHAGRSRYGKPFLSQKIREPVPMTHADAV